MKRGHHRTATPVALRGLLVLLVATVGLLCLSGRAAQDHAVPSGEVSVSGTAAVQTVAAEAPEGTEPCGKKAVTAEPGTLRADVGPQSVTTPGSPQSADGVAPPALRSGSTLSCGPAPPPPVAPFSVLRM